MSPEILPRLCNWATRNPLTPPDLASAQNRKSAAKFSPPPPHPKQRPLTSQTLLGLPHYMPEKNRPSQPCNNPKRSVWLCLCLNPAASPPCPHQVAPSPPPQRVTFRTDQKARLPTKLSNRGGWESPKASDEKRYHQPYFVGFPLTIWLPSCRHRPSPAFTACRPYS
ncbi:MAG: hypothetical protein BKPUNTRY_002570 [Candidatus Fervidibacter sp.]